MVKKRKRKRKVTERSLRFFSDRKQGKFGRGSKVICPGCGITYEAFRCGYSFASAKRELIAIGTKKDGSVLYARRNGVLGYMHGWKKSAWTYHIKECEYVWAERKKVSLIGKRAYLGTTRNGYSVWRDTVDECAKELAYLYGVPFEDILIQKTEEEWILRHNDKRFATLFKVE